MFQTPNDKNGQNRHTTVANSSLGSGDKLVKKNSGRTSTTLISRHNPTVKMLPKGDTIDPAYFYFILCILKAILSVLEGVTDFLFGLTITRGSRRERAEANLDNRCAQIVTIRWRAALSFALNHGLNNFLYIHEEYVDPAWVLDKRHVILYGFDRENVFFTVTEEDVDMWNTREIPFVFMFAFPMAKKLVIMPHHAFHRLAEKLGDPEHKVTVINMTGRCGSTLLGQMLGRLPKTRILSEPWPLIHLCEMSQDGLISMDQLDDLLKSGMRVLFKREPGTDIDHMVLKLPPMCGNLFGHFHRLFPKFNLVFNTRHPVQTLQSFNKIFANMNGGTVHQRWGFFWRMSHRATPFPLRDPYYRQLRDQYWSWFEESNNRIFTLNIASLYVDYSRTRDIYKCVVLYEELKEDPRKVMAGVFKALELPEAGLNTALVALEQDSQNGMLASRGVDEKFILSEEDKDKVDRIFKDFRVPVSSRMTSQEFIEFFK